MVKKKGVKRKKSEFIHIGELLSRSLENIRGEKMGTLSRILENWHLVVTPPADSHTKPVALKGRLLLVHVSDPSWIQHFHFGKDELIKRINRSVGEHVVDEITFKTGSV